MQKVSPGMPSNTSEVLQPLLVSLCAGIIVTMPGGLFVMERSRPEAGFTILEVIYAILIIAALVAIYVVMMDSYRERRMSEQSAKVLMQAARAQEEFFAKEHYYFDAELSGNGGEVYLSTPAGEKTSVRVPSKVVLSLRAVGKDKTAFVGHSFYAGSKVLHRYDSRTGKMTTVSRTQDESG